MRRAVRGLALCGMVSGWGNPACSQANYEIQVYGADLVPPDSLMVELHSNYTVQGQQAAIDGVYPTWHQLHETLELTRGYTDWLETGFYVFTSEQDGHGAQWVGSHLRPRVRVPESWGWPVGVSLSTEIGYQRSQYSPDTWTWEIRPIVDKSIGRWYVAVNTALERTLRGPDTRLGLDFSPAAKLGFAFTPRVSGGLEYYADYGSLDHFAPTGRQQQQLFLVTDLDVAPQWEVNLGVGVGLTGATDHLILKLILGRRFDPGRVAGMH